MRVPKTWKPSGIVGTTRGAVGTFAVYDTLESGIYACVELYNRFYRDMAPADLVRTWTDGGNPAYHSAVRSCY